LGYAPGWGSEFLYVMPFDIDGPTDSIVYSYDFGNGFTLAAFYAKDNLDPFWGNDGSPALPQPPRQNKDADRDRFGIEPRYQWDTGGFSLGLVYIRDMSLVWTERTPAAPSPLNDPNNPNHPYMDRTAWEIQINPAFVQSWGPFSIHFEGVVAWAKYTGRDVCQDWADQGPGSGYASPCVQQPDQDYKDSGLGLYLDASYNYGAGDVTLMAWYADGTSWDDRNGHDLVNMGDFAPFLVAYNGQTLGTGTWSNSLVDDPRVTDNGTLNNHWGIGLLGNHSINDDIRLNYGLGFFRLVSLPNDPRAAGPAGVGPYTGQPNRSKSLGVEIDLGATFQILDNLSFETQFGYMFNGGAYRNSRYDPDAATGDPVAVIGRKAKNTFAWANVLSVTF
jgi:hypothetical protein